MLPLKYQSHLLNRSEAAGAPGELLISGPCLARGYLNLPELTAEAFVDVPGGMGFHTRMYRTGDLACYNADGTVVIMGRLDRQVGSCTRRLSSAARAVLVLQ